MLSFYSIKIQIQNIIKLSIKQKIKMANFYFPSDFNFVPCFYDVSTQTFLYYPYVRTQSMEYLTLFKIQQPNIPLIPQEEIKQKDYQISKRNTTSEIQSQNSQTKKNIKKRRGIDKQKELQSAKKNSQSNIINQFFSYFSCRIQSQEVVEKAISRSVHKIEELEKIISIFYNIMKCMSMQRIKKYVNKKTLLNIFGRENIEKQIPQIVQKLQTLSFITIDQICEIIRRCCFYYLRNTNLVSVLSSKRISCISKAQHLKKRRIISSMVTGKL